MERNPRRGARSAMKSCYKMQRGFAARRVSQKASNKSDPVCARVKSSRDRRSLAGGLNLVSITESTETSQPEIAPHIRHVVLLVWKLHDSAPHQNRTGP